MKMSLRQMIVVVVVLTLSGISLTTAPEATWDRASSHIVGVDVYDVNGAYCHTYDYNYYVPDTTTQHYKFYHRGLLYQIRIHIHTRQHSQVRISMKLKKTWTPCVMERILMTFGITTIIPTVCPLRIPNPVETYGSHL